ncbi:MAG: SEC-C metal-binding domain-containing protein [Clostridiales bacterium]|nr:SEC-C metal-binding domain-containing protein [Clostridiales bacterium]
MTLYEKWQDQIDKQTEKTYVEFKKKYDAAEIKIYSDILANPSRTVSGTFNQLAEKYDTDEILFMGFLDGIATSLKESIDVENVETETELSLTVDTEKLYWNMHAAEAEHLYTLPEWDALLDEEKRKEIAKDYKRSKIFIKEKTPERNDPCPCGSGKKYKKCCGA